MSKVVLRYVGIGFLIGVPAKDLTEQDLSELKVLEWDKDKLIETGLYEPYEKLKKEKALENIYEQVTEKEMKEEEPELKSKKRGK